MLESKIIADDLYQLQQNTLIVWQELDGTDVAMSFEGEDGCHEIWNFLRHVQSLLNRQDWDGPEDVRASERLDDDISDEDGDVVVHEPVYLPEPTLPMLREIEDLVHLAMTSIGRRESLAKFVLSEDYVSKLIATLELAEDMESINDLHRLCNIVKALILLNDASIFESILREDVFMGIAGILEYDPEFPYHKAEHRKFLNDDSKFKEVVEVKDPEIRHKIHQTFRLQYLKDVVLARILDDPTFSILNTLIFYNQVDIIQHFQHDKEFLVALFGLFDSETSITAELERKNDAILFIQQFTGIAKTLQPQARASLYKTFVDHGLFKVLVFSLGPQVTPRIRLVGADIVMAVIDHDPRLIRGFIIEQSSKQETSLCDILITLLLSEKDIGVKAQMAEAMRLLLDPTAGPPIDCGPQKPNEPPGTRRKEPQDPEAEKFLEMFYSQSATILMYPLIETDFKTSKTFTFEQTALLTHLCELLCFFIRAHTFRAKFFILSKNISLPISQVFSTPDRHLHLAALRYFRVCIGMNDEFYNRNLIKSNLLEPLVDLLALSAQRDNLLNSAVLEFFETVRRESMKGIICNVVENFRSKLESIPLDTARALIMKYEQFQAPPPAPGLHPSSEDRKDDRHLSGRWMGRDTMDQQEQDYFERDDEVPTTAAPMTPAKRSLVDVDYDEDDSTNHSSDEPRTPPDNRAPGEVEAYISPAEHELASAELEVRELRASMDEKIGEKRRRSMDDDDDDDLPDLARNKKVNRHDGKRHGGSQGSLASAVKKKMMFSFGKRVNGVDEPAT